MCMAIGPAYTAERTALGRLWWRVASSPRRLFIASLLLQGTVLALRPATPYPTIALFGSLVALALFGALLERASRWSGRSPIHYLRLVTAAAGLNAGLLALALLSATSAGHLLSLLLLAGGYLAALGALRPHLPWMDAHHAALTRLGAALALLSGTALLFPLWTGIPL